MRSLSLYIVLILIYLGLSKSFSLSSKGTPYLVNQQIYSNFFRGDPLTVILADQFETGFLIRTSDHRYLVLHGFRSPKYITVRTSVRHYKQYSDKKGLSVFRREDERSPGDLTPMPPGTLYIGNPAFGSWERKKDSIKVWQFHRAYKNYPLLFGWGDFRPDYEFFQKAQESLSLEMPFFGLNKEFGTEGPISKGLFGKSKFESIDTQLGLKKLIENFLRTPPWKITEKIRDVIKKQKSSKNRPINGVPNNE